MRRLNQFLLLINCWMFIFITRIAKADPETNIVWQNCGSASEYREGSAFQRNLIKVLDSMIDNVSSTKFNTSVEGENGDRIYGLLQCRGDLNSSDCKQCASTAKTNLVGACHNTSGFIQQDGCFLRYDNSSFYNDLESQTGTPINVLCNSTNSSRPQQFINVVKTLLINISNTAAQSPTFFAAASVTDPSIYSIAQCWRDLSQTNCGSCLTSASSSLSQCQGALGAQFGSKNCYLRYENYVFFNTSVLSISPPPPGKNGGSGSKAIPVVVGLEVAAVAIFTAVWLWKRNYCSFLTREQNQFPESRGFVVAGEDGIQLELQPDVLNPELNFRYDILREATSNFRAENKLGEGGFGVVHRGILPDGSDVAVKRLVLGSSQGNAEFMNEINLISRVQHRNLVKLFGCCIEGSERLLVYEYLPNNSLDKILFDPRKRHLLDWKKRQEIIVGTAQGLAYLHEESLVRIIHRDIKASNILLDERLFPKIADFGLARLIGEDQTHVSTRVAGTLGYMAPEYALRGQLTEKADVFSFGVLVLEIISGMKNQTTNADMQFLLEGTWKFYEAGNASKIMDPTLDGGEEEGRLSVKRAINIALLCTQAAAALRPSMSSVVLMLTSHHERLPPPTRPAFIDTHTVTRKPKPLDTAFSSGSDAATISSVTASTSSAADPSTSSLLEPR